MKEYSGFGQLVGQKMRFEDITLGLGILRGASAPATAMAERKSVFRLSVCPSHSCKLDISGTLQENSFKFGTHYDSRMNRLELGCQSSEVKRLKG